MRYKCFNCFQPISYNYNEVSPSDLYCWECGQWLGTEFFGIDDSSQKGEGNADSSQDKDNSNQSQDKDNTDQNKQDSLLPPPTQIQSCIKVLHEIQTLQNYLSTIK